MNSYDISFMYKDKENMEENREMILENMEERQVE
jgi:hypothetical protein